MRAVEEIVIRAERPRVVSVQRLVEQAFSALLLPLGVTLLTLRTLVPSRMEARGGVSAFVAAIGDEHPLLLGLALFLAFSTVSRHWHHRYREARPQPGLEDARPRSIAPGRARRARARHFVAALGAISLVAVLVRASVVEIFWVTSPSMVPALNVGDRLLVNRLAYGLRLPFSNHILRPRPPRRGDVIVFPGDAAGGAGPGQPSSLVKRVLGLPGDVISFRSGSAIVNGWTVPTCDAGPFVSTAGATLVRGRVAVELLEDRTYLTIRLPLDETRLDDYRVPPGEVFVMGDDRGQSSDSRAWNEGRGGSVPINRITGRVSRLAVGAFRDGRLDLGRVLARLGLQIREPHVDLRKTEARIATCVAAPRPPSTWPPEPPGGSP